jgi:hypothetical protein
VDPIRPITRPPTRIPPVVAAGRIERVTRRRRDPRERPEEEEAENREGEAASDDGHPHVDVSA